MRHKQFCPNLIKQMETLKDGRKRKTPKFRNLAVQAVFGEPGLTSFPPLKRPLPSSWLVRHTGRRCLPTVNKPGSLQTI